MEHPRISACTLSFLTRDPCLPGAARDALLARHGLHLDAVSLDARSGAPADIPLAAFVGVVEDLATVSNVPLIGWRTGERFALADLGALGLALSLAPTLGDALRCLERAFCTLQTGTHTRLIVEDGEACFSYAILDHRIWPRRQDAELTLGLIAALIQRVRAPEPPPLAVGFEHGAGSDTPALAARLRHDIAHGEDTNRISFPARLLDAPLPDPADAGFAAVSRALEQLARDRRRAQTLRTRVKQAVLEDMGQGPVDQTRIAQTLGMSRRTLRRRLEASGDRFRQLVEECRQSRAQAYLTRTDWPLSEIALRLGYSDQTAFSRAFSRWHGKPPHTVRAGARDARA